ncbi:MAG TPA: ATP-binding cassette domain-containing protein, partial [Candidatus Corynebacterium faecipullorum]|nr:ATP-binding cassette domain-containing protein [Candidatus Corynebacterium faecipullorum]
FPAKRQCTPVGDLSGGERRRLQLTRVLMAEPNVLLLDEPTNDLDIDTLQELESLLDSWPGTLVVISHDRYLIERIADNTYALFGDGKLTNLPGGIEEYLRRRQEMEAATARGVLDLGEASKDADEQSAEAAPAKRLSSQEERELTKKMNALERKMSKLDDKTAKLNEKMAQAAEKMSSGEGDSGELAKLDSELKAVAAEREELEMEWLELGEKLEG